MSKRNILYLNVNGFLGKKEKKEIYKNISDAREKIRKEKIIIYDEKMAQEISLIDNNDNEKLDMIFLSEIDPHSPATNRSSTCHFERDNRCGFINTINQNNAYDILCPSAKYIYLEDIPVNFYSCTICLKKTGLNYTNEGNGFNPNTEDKDCDYLQICKVKNEKVVLLAIHAKDGEAFERSIKRLLKDAANIIVLGDTNANPDAKIENKKDAFERNCRFEHLMKKLGLHEIVPVIPDGKSKEEIYTSAGNTRIDRVFTNMPGVTVEVKKTFLKNNLSDHAALLISYEEN